MPKHECIITIIRALIPEHDLADAIVVWDSHVYEQGELLSTGPAGVAMPFRGTFVFVDLKPRANWAHPCIYIALPEPLPPTTDEIDPAIAVQIKSSFPPRWYLREDLSDSASVLLRFNRVPDEIKTINPFQR